MKGKYAQRYLSEFERRFNRRYDLPSMVPRLRLGGGSHAADPGEAAPQGDRRAA